MLKRGVSSFCSYSGNRVTGKKGKGIRRILILGELLVRRENPGEWARRGTSCVFIGLETLGDTSGLISNRLLISIFLCTPKVSYVCLFCRLGIFSWLFHVSASGPQDAEHLWDPDLKINWELRLSFLHLLPSAAWDASVVFLPPKWSLNSEFLSLWNPDDCVWFTHLCFLKNASVFLFTDLWKSSETHWCLYQILF